MKLFVEADYQGGMRCCDCGRAFRDGERVHPVDAGEFHGVQAWAPQCARCHAGRGEQMAFGAGEQLELAHA